ncbi:MAG: hypothetical protein ACI8SC_000825 [Colwellia sp.]|jgi:hypothetical protein
MSFQEDLYRTSLWCHILYAQGQRVAISIAAYRVMLANTAYESVKPARWRKAVIEGDLKGENNPLCGQRCFDNYLGVSDILKLLIKVEQIIVKELESSEKPK